MKKLGIVLLLIVMVFALAACGGGGSTPSGAFDIPSGYTEMSL